MVKGGVPLSGLNDDSNDAFLTFDHDDFVEEEGQSIIIAKPWTLRISVEGKEP